MLLGHVSFEIGIAALNSLRFGNLKEAKTQHLLADPFVRDGTLALG